MNNEHERYNLNPQQFAEYKKKAEERGGSVRVPGTSTYIPASKESKEKRHQKTRDFHESLVPMKNTLNESGSSYGRLSIERTCPLEHQSFMFRCYLNILVRFKSNLLYKPLRIFIV